MDYRIAITGLIVFASGWEAKQRDIRSRRSPQNKGVSIWKTFIVKKRTGHAQKSELVAGNNDADWSFGIMSKARGLLETHLMRHL